MARFTQLSLLIENLYFLMSRDTTADNPYTMNKFSRYLALPHTNYFMFGGCSSSGIVISQQHPFPSLSCGQPCASAEMGFYELAAS